MVPHFTFDLYFSNHAVLSIFSCGYWPSVVLLWKNVCFGLLLVFQFSYGAGGGHLLLLLSCMNCLYILEIYNF